MFLQIQMVHPWFKVFLWYFLGTFLCRFPHPNFYVDAHKVFGYLFLIFKYLIRGRKKVFIGVSME